MSEIENKKEEEKKKKRIEKATAAFTGAGMYLIGSRELKKGKFVSGLKYQRFGKKILEEAFKK